jgi:hypothetical protein
MDNPAVAALLREMAELLQAQGEENAFRIAAYRHAADTVAALEQPVREILAREGMAGLDALPTVGAGIAAAIAEIVQTGHWTKLERLRGGAAPEALLRTVPGVGPRLALQLHEELGIDTLEGLEAAAHDGRLEALAGVGPRRAASLRAALTERLDRERAARRFRPAAPADHVPPAELLLEVDRAYRERAEAGTLPKIAPRRFNPDGVAWLPVLHTRRGEWSVTALYSNTARAHELGRVHDWVVLYAEDGAHHERQYTVVTAQRGPLAGRRVVRGREDECRVLPA